MESDKSEEKLEELSVSFGYQFKMTTPSIAHVSNLPPQHQYPENQQQKQEKAEIEEVDDRRRQPHARCRRGASFSCLSGAALSANVTLANTAIGNGRIGQEILPGLDSPKSFRPLGKSPSFSKIESLMSSSMAATSPTFGAPASAPQRLESRSFLSAADAQTAGGAAGEDRVQAVCSEEDGWLFCAIYDGFNGRDAADFLAGTLYENISQNLTQLVWQTQFSQKCHSHEQEQQQHDHEEGHEVARCREDAMERATTSSGGGEPHQGDKSECKQQHDDHSDEQSFRDGVLGALRKALMETEAGFMEMVEQDMDERPDLVMVGSCVLVVLLHDHYLYTLSLGDSRAVLATKNSSREEMLGTAVGLVGEEAGPIMWVQLTQDHVLTERAEKERVIREHPEDRFTIVSDRVKGKIKLTRAFGAGYLKQAYLNEKLMGMLRVPNLSSPPYISGKPHLGAHKVCAGDEFVVMGSDGLFDFFSNAEVVSLVHRFIRENPSADPARYMLDQLLIRAADSAGMTLERLKNIQIGRRRAYHDDVTIIVVALGAKHRTSSASIS